jgi:AsmA protein
LEVHGDLESGDWRVERVAVNASAALTRGERSLQGEARLAGSATLRGADQTVDVTLEQAVAEGTGTGLPLAAGRAELSGRISGDLAQRAWRVDRLALTGTARGGRLPDTDHAFSLSAARVVADLEAQTASAQDVRIDALGVRGTLSAAGTGIVDAPVFTGMLAFEGFSPRALLGLLSVQLPETRDPSALTHLAISTSFRATRSSVALTELDAQLDASRMRGRFAVSDFESQALRFDLDIDQLDLDRYLGPETETVDPNAGEFDAIEIPVETIRALDIDGALRIASLRAIGLTSEAVAITVRAQGGSLRVNPASARMYGGTYEGDIGLDVSGVTPRLSVNERVTGVQAGALFADLFDEARIVGTADMSARVTGTGLTVGAIRRTLDGRITFSFRDGAVKGFDLWHMIRDARAVMRAEARPERPAGEPQTAFGRLSGSGTVTRGVMNSDDLAAQLPYMTVAGGGTFDLAESVVDYRLRVTVQRVPGVDGQEGEGELAGLSVPVVISGPLSDLSYRVDLASILRDRVQQEVDSARRRLEQELLDRLRRGIR